MEIKAKVLQSLPMEGGTSKSGNAWQKASLIVETTENPQYPKKNQNLQYEKCRGVFKNRRRLGGDF